MAVSDTQTFAAPPFRLGGLDGLRALAVGLVLVYHLWPHALPGGFLGVDVFFVISGFLITTLLLREQRASGRLDLVGFWRRRARRLLPALALVLLTCTTAALAIGGDVLVRIGAQLFGAAAFVANWVYIGLGTDYFTRDNPELYRNTWSLAIEEQFYLVLPLLMLVLVLRMRARLTRVFFFALLAAASAWWMAELYQQSGLATRAYFGTDTHSFGLLLGVALACALTSSGQLTARGRSRETEPIGAVMQATTLIVGLAGLGTLGLLAVTLHEGSPESFGGGFQLASLAVLCVVWAATRPGALLGRAIDTPPLRWIGERSYGLYLWHWPVLILVQAGLAERPDSWLSQWLAAPAGAWARPWAVPILVLTVTVVAATLSHSFLEQPVRRLGLRRSLALMLRPARLRGRRLSVGIALVAAVCVMLPATVIAVASAPSQSSAEAAIARGKAAMEAAQAAAKQDGVAAATSNEDRDRADTESAAGAAQPVSGVGDLASPSDDQGGWATGPEFEAPPPTPYTGADVFAVGDSVMLASYPELAAELPGAWVDADVSRGLRAGVGIVRGIAAEGGLRKVIVVGLGTNGPIDRADLDELLRIAGDCRIVLVNAHADRRWIPGVNAQLREFADAHRGVVLADWDAAVAPLAGALAGDGIHPNRSGAVVYAQLVHLALDALLERDEQPLRTPR